jgi:hypothetical protein
VALHLPSGLSGTGQTHPVFRRNARSLGPLGAPKSLEIPANGPGEGQGREIFFLSHVPVVGVPRRKQFSEMPFGFEEVHRFALEVLCEAAKFDLIVERISVHNVVAYQ